jgi:dTDP-4-amino-4,6-dideoxygalactose transaminase
MSKDGTVSIPAFIDLEWLTDRVISLPMHGYLSEEAQDFVIDTVLDALRSGAGSVAAE